jgi:hypothetical protein
MKTGPQNLVNAQAGGQAVTAAMAVICKQFSFVG